ncbi:MAG: DedA family protein [Bacteroidetes bacterium]|nr:DedA family protein [Bacteroidota bacterium]MBU1678097.1 DedA family protein [Bacteroidota bacterium]MBU2507101.1 DedA family protein [Bacteroidota bacterium]
MLEEILHYMSTVDPIVLYLILFFFCYIENIFPPSPSDVVVVFGASLIASTSLSYIPILLITSFGSSLGFVLMYYVGKIFGERVVLSGKLKFITQESISKTDIWFSKYGYKLILLNRFLPGTRSLVSFFSGLYELDLWRTFVLATISAFLWNAIIIYLGMLLGNNVEMIDYYLSTYSMIIMILTLLVIIFFIIRWQLKEKEQRD